VAVLGTALGAGHVQLLRRYAERIRVVLVLDGDEAGRARAREVLELFVSANVDLRVLTLPDGADPADYLFAHGAEAFAALVDSASDALEHAFRSATAGIDLQADVHAASAALEHLAGTIAKAPRLRADTRVEDRLREEKFLQRLAADFRVPEEQVRELVTKYRRKSAARGIDVATASAAASVREKIDPLERELLELLLQNPRMIERVSAAVEAEQLASATCRRLVAQSTRLWSAGVLPDYARLLLENDDPGIKNLLVELDEGGRDKPAAEAEVRLQDVLAGFERRERERAVIGHAQALRKQQLPEEDAQALLLELEQHFRAEQQAKAERSRLGISEPTEG
jgi:DNA primase